MSDSRCCGAANVPGRNPCGEGGTRRRRSRHPQPAAAFQQPARLGLARRHPPSRPRDVCTRLPTTRHFFALRNCRTGADRISRPSAMRISGVRSVLKESKTTMSSHQEQDSRHPVRFISSFRVKISTDIDDMVTGDITSSARRLGAQKYKISRGFRHDAVTYREYTSPWGQRMRLENKGRALAEFDAASFGNGSATGPSRRPNMIA